MGHIPRKLSTMCTLFLQQGGTIACQVNGNRQYSRDLTQGGLKIPCILTFNGEEKEISKVHTLIHMTDTFTVIEKFDPAKSVTYAITISQNPCKKPKV